MVVRLWCTDLDLDDCVDPGDDLYARSALDLSPPNAVLLRKHPDGSHIRRRQAILAATIWTAGSGLWFGIPSIDWPNDVHAVIAAFILATDWTKIPFFMIMYLTAFQTIPRDYYAAAETDGASARQRFWHTAPPHLRPRLLLVVVTSITFLSFVWPYLVATHDSLRSLRLGLQLFERQSYTDYSQVMAISTIAFISLVVMSALFQRGSVQGVALSGSKE